VCATTLTGMTSVIDTTVEERSLSTTHHARMPRHQTPSSVQGTGDIHHLWCYKNTDIICTIKHCVVAMAVADERRCTGYSCQTACICGSAAACALPRQLTFTPTRVWSGSNECLPHMLWDLFLSEADRVCHCLLSYVAGGSRDTERLHHLYNNMWVIASWWP